MATDTPTEFRVSCSSILTSVDTPPVLTTVFTPPPICSTYFTDGWRDTSNKERDASGATQDYRDPVWYSCVPKEYDIELCPLLTFSPGICPHGWRTLSMSVDGDVTIATCCMSGFTIDKYGGCSKNTKDFIVTRRANPEDRTISISSWDSDTAYWSADGQTVSQVFSEVDTDDPPESMTLATPDPYSPGDGENVTMTTGHLLHTAWVVMWQSSDGIHTNATTTPSGATKLPETDDGNTGLSRGGIAGVVIGVLAAFGLGVMMGLLIRRRRQRPLVASGPREQPMAVSEVNSGGGFASEQRSNGTAPPDMAYAAEGGTAAGPSHQQSRPWLAFLGSRGRRNVY